MFCPKCGKEVFEDAVVCIHCGRALSGSTAEVAKPGQKDWLTALLLCIFLGGLGIHRFYSGHTGIGLIQLITLGGCGIWTLIDLIKIATGSYVDANGQPLFKK